MPFTLVLRRPTGRTLRQSVSAYRNDLLHTHPNIAHTLGMLLDTTCDPKVAKSITGWICETCGDSGDWKE